MLAGIDNPRVIYYGGYLRRSDIKGMIYTIASRIKPAPKDARKIVGTSEIDGIAHELWVYAQLAPEEGISDGVGRIVACLREHGMAHPQSIGY
jgi:hypothetical protein